MDWLFEAMFGEDSYNIAHVEHDETGEVFEIPDEINLCVKWGSTTADFNFFSNVPNTVSSVFASLDEHNDPSEAKGIWMADSAIGQLSTDDSTYFKTFQEFFDNTKILKDELDGKTFIDLIPECDKEMDDAS